MKGNTAFVFTTLFFITFIIFMAGLVAVSNPGFTIVSPFDAAVFGGSFIAVAAACVVATGVPCAAALAFFSVIGFVATTNTFLTVLFIPLSATVAYVLSRLARGGG